MHIIKLDATDWATPLHFYEALLPELGAPSWHGKSIDAIIDSMIGGGINTLKRPYTVRVHNLARTPADVIEEVEYAEGALARARARLRPATPQHQGHLRDRAVTAPTVDACLPPVSGDGRGPRPPGRRPHPRGSRASFFAGTAMTLFPTEGSPKSLPGRLLAAHPRLFLGLAVAVLVFIAAPAALPEVTRLLVAWNVGTLLFIALDLQMIATSDERTIRWRAGITDEGQFAVLVLTSLAALASMTAIFAELGIAKDLKGLDKGLHLALAGLTIVSAWVFIHLTFALHYAHEYFDEAKNRDGGTPSVRGGIKFPGTEDPDYWDFLYFAFIIGVAAQTADVSITAKVIRRTSLVHSILAFFFNSAILALTINIAASLI